MREAMIGVALAGGDPDDLIEVRRHDLRVPDDHSEIARTLHSAGRTDEAIERARQGLDIFADRAWQTPPLRAFLSKRLREHGDTAGAVDPYWDAYEHPPPLESYRRLLAECPAEDTERWRSRCIESLHSRIADSSGDVPQDRAGRPAAVPQVLVEILGLARATSTPPGKPPPTTAVMTGCGSCSPGLASAHTRWTPSAFTSGRCPLRSIARRTMRTARPSI